MNHRMIRNILGWLLLFECGFLILPVIIGLIYGEYKIALVYLISAAISAAVGFVLKIGKIKRTTLFARDGFVIVTLSWITMSLFGAVPMFLTKEIPSFLNALFESISGFTTTGATIIDDVEILSHATQFWRSFSHWIGGMGVLVFLMAFLPLSGAQNMHIMKAESSGPSVSKLVPRVRTTALILYVLYFSFTFAEFIFLVFGPMDVFESMCTALSTAGTGGFGIRNDSLASVGLYSQMVVTAFMLIFSVTFTSYYLIICKRISEAFTTEVKTFFLLVGSSVAILTVIVRNCFDSLFQAFKNCFFTVAATMSSTGFVCVDYEAWPKSAHAIILFLMF
ncbi:MAG: TrkH family potassium uptake protein, partial [Clostridia bacterium]|nr:TrkH family potassium uptake protein [Clostridia bacterium]